MNKPDPKTLRRFAKLAKPFFFSEIRWQARALLILLFCFSIVVSRFNVEMSFIGRDFMNAFAARQQDEFLIQLGKYLLAFCGATFLVVSYRYTEERLGLMWRRWLTIHILKKYFKNKSYYQIGFMEGIDNPDQRIEEDVRTFTNVTLSFTLIICNSIITLYGFMSVLWDISKLLPFAAIGYSVGGSVVAYFLGRPLINLNFAQLKKDADYRYKLINVRDNSESIAFLEGESKELSRVRQRLKTVLDNMLAIINWNRNLSLFVTPYNYIISILPIVIVAPLYLRHEIELGVVTQAGIAFGYVLGALSIIVANFGQISNFAAVIKRLGSFVETLDQIGNNQVVQVQRDIEIRQADQLMVCDLTLYTPQGDREVLKNLSIEGVERLLVTGPSGSGKSSFLRSLAGVWNYGHGQIMRPASSDCMFLPQRPYIVLGSFRAQFLYPINWKGLTDDDIIQAIELVGLQSTLQRVGGLERVHNWAQMLSAGEQQLISMARFVLSKRNCIFLDESTTALDRETEERLYNIIVERCRLIVSVGYSGTLGSYHTHRLQLLGGGEWKLSQL